MSISAAHDNNDALRRLEGEYDAAWNRGDVAALISLYEASAVVVNPLGETARGHSAIRSALEEFLAGRAKGSRHTSTITDIAYVRDAVAVVDGEARLDGLRGAESASIVHRFTDVVIRTDNGWLIAHTRAYVFAKL